MFTLRVTLNTDETIPAQEYDWSTEDNVRIIKIYSGHLVEITRNSAEECISELRGQITDGLFENYRVNSINFHI